jgi:hypothetical protein
MDVWCEGSGGDSRVRDTQGSEAGLGWQASAGMCRRPASGRVGATLPCPALPARTFCLVTGSMNPEMAFHRLLKSLRG